MEDLDALEVYIPMEAEVESIPVLSLPKAVLTKKSFPVDGSEVPLADSPNAVWISPAVIRMKGQLAPSSRARESIVSLLSQRLETAQGPFNMAFVSSNRTAYRVLKETLPGSKVSPTTSHTPLLPLGSRAQTRQNALVIHRGQIYLTIKGPASGCKGGRNRIPNPPTPASPPSTTALSPGTQEMDLLTHDQRKRTRTTSAVQHSENQDHYEPPSKMVHPSSPRPAGVLKVDNLCQYECSQPADRHAARESLLFQPQKDKEEVASAFDGPCVSPDAASPDADLCVSSEAASGPYTCPEVASPDGGLSATPEVSPADSDPFASPELGYEDSQSADGVTGSHSWNRKGSFSAVVPGHEVDFNELVQEEKIARMKAKLRESEAALSRLQLPH